MSESVVIVSGARTPMGGLQGELSAVSAVELGTTAIKATLDKVDFDPANIDEVIMGCVLPGGLKQGPARQAAIHAGIPTSTGCVTINKLCGSGMQATVYAHDQIKAGSCDVALVGGMENMSRAPHIIMGARGGLGTGHRELYDHMFLDGLEDAYTGKLMGAFAQQTADNNNISRESMDNFAIESTNRAQAAIENGLLREEIAPVTITSRKGETVVEHDEQPSKARLDKIPSLRPAFAKDGTITAATASSISDGASALLLMSDSAAQQYGLSPMAKIVAHARHSQNPEDFTIAPIGAIEAVLAKANWQVDDVELWEINEAFAMVTMLAMEKLGLDHAKVNIFGGACAQGHPIGSTGSRIILTLITGLKHRGLKRGIASLCIGGGEGLAVAIELL